MTGRPGLENRAVMQFRGREAFITRICVHYGRRETLRHGGERGRMRLESVICRFRGLCSRVGFVVSDSVWGKCGVSDGLKLKWSRRDGI